MAKKPENIEMGQRIRKRRELLRMSREELASGTGLSVRFLTTVETGAGGASVPALRSIASALDMSYDYLFTSNEQSQLEHDMTSFLRHIRPEDRDIACECLTTLLRLYDHITNA